MFESRAPTPKRPWKISEQIAHELVTHIVKNNLPEGARLPHEAEMVEQLGVGRSTLREALRLLETRGVITIRPGRDGGPVVRRPRTTDLGEALSLLMFFEGSSLADVLAAREALEPMIARLAAQNITADEVDVLRSTVATMRTKIDQERFTFENRRLHATVAGASRNMVLQAFNDALAGIADGVRIGVTYSSRRMRAVADAHEIVTDALERGDEDGAAAAMSTHMGEAGQYWQNRYRDLLRSPITWRA